MGGANGTPTGEDFGASIAQADRKSYLEYRFARFDGACRTLFQLQNRKRPIHHKIGALTKREWPLGTLCCHDYLPPG